MIGQFSTLVLSIDAPLRMLLDNEEAREFIPSGLLKKNKYGAYINGIWMKTKAGFTGPIGTAIRSTLWKRDFDP